jgi:hypothetical protein
MPEPLAPPMSHRAPAGATIAMLPEAPSAHEDAFEFAFDAGGRSDALGEPVDPGELGHATLLDPAAGSGLDISSSDLDYSRDPASATKILSLDGPESLPLAAEDAELDLAETDPFDAPLADAGEPLDGPDPFATTLAPLDRAPRHEGSFDPFERDPFDDAPVMEGEPLSVGEELDPEPVFAPEPAVAVELDADPWDDAPSFAPEPATAAAELDTPSGSPAMARAELHDMIEKIAWDAFGPITEKVVREAIARIEQVVWEVVPKLAETLIQEEIRRLKDGSS